MGLWDCGSECLLPRRSRPVFPLRSFSIRTAAADQEEKGIVPETASGTLRWRPAQMAIARAKSQAPCSRLEPILGINETTRWTRR